MALIDLYGWVDEQLSSVLNFPVPEDLIRYILAIENVRDLEDYLKTLLDFNNPQHCKFFSELLEKRQQGLCGSVSDVRGYKKLPIEQDFVMRKHNEKKKKLKVSSEENVVFQGPVENAQTKKKQKYVNLYSQEGQDKDVILLKGRHSCECQASKHRLINNCLKCGRIVCEQEGSGPCLFCNALVCSPEEQEVLNSKTKKAEKLYQKLVDTKGPQNWEKAIQHRDRLLEYDRTSERRTKVIDDESDYFAANSVWLTKAEREKLQEKEAEIRARRHASQRNKKITLDFAGRQVIEEIGNAGVYQDVEELLQNPDISTQAADVDDRSEFPEILSSMSMFQDSSISLDEETLKNHMVGMTPDRNSYRIQDREFLEMSDGGFCLSMHQPWASFLVHGIKLHEGRTWYTPHRGRLWIAATAKVPNPQDIVELESIYHTLVADDIKFPTSYPVSCLLGCVNVVECLPQEEYKEKFPNGESDSPFVYICKEPKELPLKFPIQGRHKIYKLDPKIHEAAKNLLMRAARQQAERSPRICV